MLLQASKRLRKFFDLELSNEAIWHEIIHLNKLDNLHQLTSLNAEAAHHLVNKERRLQLLSLGITGLEPEVAGELAQYKGDRLYLNCIHTLSPEAAKGLSQFKGARLALNGLKTITLPVLGRLASYKGSLFLDGVETIEITAQDSTRAETVFKNLGFTRFSLAGLKTVALPSLKALARFPGQLELNGLETLSEQQSGFLAEHTGPGLSLKGIKVLAMALKPLLEKYAGVLDLSGAKEVERAILYIILFRPPERSFFSAEARKHILAYKKEAREAKIPGIETLLVQPLPKEKPVPEKVASDKELLAEFARFDQMELTIPVPAAPTAAEEEEIDDFEIAVSDDVLNDIEINLNLKINQKKRQVDELLAKGQDKLTEDQRRQVRELQEEIEELKLTIRRALDILVERKELGAVVFNASSDLAAYLKAAGTEDDENDALANIEDKDLFADCFETQTPESGVVIPIQGEDFVMK